MQSRYSDRRTRDSAIRRAPSRTLDKRRTLILGLFVAILAGGAWGFVHGSSTRGAQTAPKPVTTLAPVAKKSTIPVNTQKPAAAATPIAAASTLCDDNQLDKAVIISISKRHLWACETKHSAYDSAVVTGMENIAADLTPTGTYHIYGKQTNLYLNGSDSTGSWHDYVYYWMPFLNNQYGTYGFHDATWRAAGDFGNIDPYSDKGSHGCVELPLATAKWLFNWAAIGTTVIIQH